MAVVMEMKSANGVTCRIYDDYIIKDPVRHKAACDEAWRTACKIWRNIQQREEESRREGKQREPSAAGGQTT